MGLRQGRQRAAARRRRCTTHPHRAALVHRDEDPAEELALAGARDTILYRRSILPDHIREYTEKSLENLGVSAIDLQQFHVWSDAWADDERWQRAVRRSEAREG